MGARDTPVAADFRSGTDRLTHRILLRADAGVTTAEIGGPVVALERRLREVSQHSTLRAVHNTAAVIRLLRNRCGRKKYRVCHPPAGSVSITAIPPTSAPWAGMSGVSRAR